MRTATFLAFALALGLLGNPLSLAQPVYKAPGTHGPVYSDLPQPGGRQVELPPVNVVPATRIPSAAPASVPAAQEAAAFVYRSFRIVLPEDDSSVSDNTALFELRVASEPPLALERGHAFKVKLNGKEVPGRFTATEFLLPPEFFGDSVTVNQRFRIEAQIVDREGGTLIEAKPVDVTMRAVSRAPARRVPPPRPMPAR